MAIYSPGKGKAAIPVAAIYRAKTTVYRDLTAIKCFSIGAAAPACYFCITKARKVKNR